MGTNLRGPEREADRLREVLRDAEVRLDEQRKMTEAAEAAAERRLDRAEAAEAEVERLRGEVAHWEHHAWEAGEGFKRAIEAGNRAHTYRRAAEAERDALRRAVEALADEWHRLSGWPSNVAVPELLAALSEPATAPVLDSHLTGTPEGDASPAAVDTPLTRPTCMACGWQAPAGAEAPSTCPACAGAASPTETGGE